MADFNMVMLIGRLTSDPELRYTPGGQAVTDLRLATSRKYKTAGGESREDKLFIDVTAWSKTAENCCQYLRKGRAVHVVGRLKMEAWDDKKTGEKRSKLKVEADSVQFLDGPRDDDGPAREPEPRDSPRRGSSTWGGKAPDSSYRPAPPSDPDDDDGDIPFASPFTGDEHLFTDGGDPIP